MSKSVSLDLLADPDQYLFIEKDMCWGMRTITKANKPYLVQGCGKDIENSDIIYLDCNWDITNQRL